MSTTPFLLSLERPSEFEFKSASEVNSKHINAVLKLNLIGRPPLRIRNNNNECSLMWLLQKKLINIWEI